MKKIWISVIAIVVLVLIVISVSKSLAKKGQNQKIATSVRLDKPVRGDLIEYVTCPGTIQPKKKVTISAKVSARIIAIPYEAGARVTHGISDANPPVPASILVKLDATELETDLKIAESREEAQCKQIEVEKMSIKSSEDSLRSTEASLKMAQLDFKRMEGLLQTQDVSQSDYDKAKTAYDELSARYDSDKHRLESSLINIEVLQHNLEAAKAEILRAKEALTYTTITSPIDGIITQLNAEVGEVTIFGTMNNPGTMIMEVADMSKMLVAAEIDEVEISKVKKGQKAKIRIAAYPDRIFTGVVDNVALKSSTSKVGGSFYKAEILMDSNSLNICLGLTADVDIEVNTHKNVLKVPTQAILGRKVDDLPADIRDSNLIDKMKTYATIVYRFNGGKAVATPVKMGPSDISDTAILEGVDVNDQIVTGPYKILETLRHDQAIKDEKEDKKDIKNPAVVKNKNKKTVAALDAKK